MKKTFFTKSAKISLKRLKAGWELRFTPKGDPIWGHPRAFRLLDYLQYLQRDPNADYFDYF